MKTTIDCGSLEEVRTNIDRIDRQMVSLLAERGQYVAQAARFKTDAQAVAAPARVEQVITRVVGLARELGADVEVVERVYRAMISAFIDAELSEHARLRVGAERD